MGRSVKAYEVNNINNVDTTKYNNGDIFFTSRSLGILINGKILTLNTGLNKNDVRKIVKETLKKEGDQ